MLNGAIFATVIDFVAGKNIKETNREIERTGKALDNTNKQVQSARKNFANLAGAFTGIFAAGLVKNALVSIIKPAMDFETAIERIGALTGVSGDALKKFESEAKKVAAVTPYGPQEMATVLLELQKATKDSTVALQILRPTAQLAMASFDAMTPIQAAKMMGELVRGFNLTGTEAADAAERITAVSKASGLGIENFSKVMGKLGMARTLGGQSLDQMLMAFALTKQAINSDERAASELIRTLSDIGSTKTRNALQAVGIDMDKFAGKPLKLSEIMTELHGRYTKSTTSMRYLINSSFGSAAAKPILAILGQMTEGVRGLDGHVHKGADAFKYLNESMQKSGGILETLSTRYMGTTAAKLSEMLENLRILGMTVGKTLLPSIGNMAATFRSIAEVLTALGGTAIGQYLFGTGAKIIAVSSAIWALKASFQGLAGIFKVVSINLGLMNKELGVSFVAGAAKATTSIGYLVDVFKSSGFREGIAALEVTLRGLGAIPIAGILAIAAMPEIEAGVKRREKTIDELIKGEAKRQGIELKDSQELRLETEKKALSLIQKSSEIAQAAWKNVYGYMELGSQTMIKAIDKLKGIADYDPPIVKFGAAYAMRKQLQTIMKSAPEEMQTEIQNAVNATYTAERLAKKSTMPGGITPDEQRILQTSLAMAGAVGADLASLNMGMPASVLKNFRKGVVHPFAEMGSLQNLAYQELLIASRGGRRGTKGMPYIPGYSAETGGYPGGVSAMPGWVSKELLPQPGVVGGPQSSKYLTESSDIFKPGFTPASAEFKKSATQALLAEQANHTQAITIRQDRQIEQNAAQVDRLADIQRILSMGIEVKVKKRDPFSSQADNLPGSD